MPSSPTIRTRSWPNGIMARKEGPALSWFTAPLESETAEAWINCIDADLAALPSIGAASNINRIVERFRAANAFDPPNCLASVPSALHERGIAQRVLVLDEPASVYLQAPRRERERQFARMLDAIHREQAGAEIWFARSRTEGSGEWLSSAYPEINVADRHIGTSESLCASLPHFDHLYTLSSVEGMQALLCGVPVHVFGSPYYAGWGLTHDDAPQPARRSRATLESLFEVVFMRFSRYLAAAGKTSDSLEALLDAIEAHRATVLRFADLRHVAGIRFQWWKRPFATPFLTAGGGTLRWIDDASKLGDGEHAAFWGARSTEGVPPNASTVRIEDGFLHSIGLGSDHVAPYSQIIDRRGLYFDPSRPSDLTEILNKADFSEAELARAGALRGEIARLGLTKYNLGRRKPAWHAPAGKRVVLVPGQVADDASIRLGTRGITTTEDLLLAVRARRPDAFIVYKPHPDVLSGNRRGLIEASALVDVMEQDSDLISLIEIADEVHTLSSLSGFEALLRQKAVYTYGLPFYAGWGLTHDTLTPLWRERKLSLDMLTAGVLLRYPIYWDWDLNLFTSPETIIQKLAIPAKRPLTKIRGNRLRPLLKAVRWSKNGIQHLAWRCRK
ncbi:capsular biosynthesis protein [Burkholderia aenigmatica]|uniref:Capsular biosynthesis protein n=2 Tax=Burkholderia aenigmatica TaxID=2015348 RepID=A0A228J4H4_9BURK|nr:capsular biosynthesis protein [Burkholderia aenigmatica]